MNSRRVWIMVSLALGIAITVPALANDLDDIKAAQERYVVAFRAKDLDGVMRFYVPDKTLLVFDVVPPRQFIGADAYRKDWKEFFDSVEGPITVEMADFKADASGQLAYTHSIQHVSAVDKKGQKIDFTARVTDVFRKNKGRWLVIHEHFSVPVDLDTGKADLNSTP